MRFFVTVKHPTTPPFTCHVEAKTARGAEIVAHEKYQRARGDGGQATRELSYVVEKAEVLPVTTKTIPSPEQMAEFNRLRAAQAHFQQAVSAVTAITQSIFISVDTANRIEAALEVGCGGDEALALLRVARGVCPICARPAAPNDQSVGGWCSNPFHETRGK